MSGPIRQQIRPGIEELRKLPPEYDFSDEAEDDGNDDDDDVPTYAPAASTSRSLPPKIETVNSSNIGSILKGKGKKDEKKIKSVRIAESVEGEKERIASKEGRHQRFVLPLEDEGEGEESEELENSSEDEVTKIMPSLAPVMGTIQERKPLDKTASTSNIGKTERAGTSRFAARRQLDRDAGIAKPVQQGHPVAKRMSVVSDHNNDEIWLDEEGNPMSAFRKNRLIKQGLRPPSVRTEEKGEEVRMIPIPSNQGEESNPSSISALMKSISAENDAKIAAMSTEEVEHDLQDIRETFGSNLLEMLKNRHKKEVFSVDTTEVPQKARTLEPAPVKSSPDTSKVQGTPAYIRQKYFPNEPEALPNSLHWTQDLPTSKDKGVGEHRFDFSGHLIDVKNDEDETHLSGLHHHGDEQEKPGYTIQELIHLARSTLSSQRVLALQTLGRIATVYPEMDMTEIQKGPQSRDAVTKDIMKSNLRGQSCIVASWYLEDRQLNVRSAALACIKACLSSTLVGPDPQCFVEVPLSKSGIQSQKQDEELTIAQPQKEETPKLPSIHDFELQEGLVNSLLHSLHAREVADQEGLLSLQILLHMSKRSRQIGKKICNDSRTISDIITKYLLKQSWSEDPSKSQMSLLTLELMQCFIASSREVALSLAFKDFTVKLIRFVAIPPWSAPTSAQPSSWRHLNLTLQLFTMLARYGIGADTYSHSHSAFIEFEQWIRHFKVDPASSKLRSIKLQTLRSALSLMAAWTVCASDAHKTYGYHDITWSQVSEWDEIGVAVLQNLQGAESTPEEVETVQVQGEAFYLLCVWKKGAEINRANEVQSLKLDMHIAHEQIQGFLSRIQNSLTYYSNLLTAEARKQDEVPFWYSQIPYLNMIAELTYATSAVIEFDDANEIASSSSLTTVIHQVLYEIPWKNLHRTTMIQAGSAGAQRYIVDFLCQAILSMPNEEVQEEYWLHLLYSLPSGMEETAEKILTKHLPAPIGDEGSAEMNVLSPFLKELVRKTNKESIAPLRPTISSLKEVETLFIICQASSAQDQEEEETDPLSGAPLWKCVNHGLPLRKDWPLVALDDLLHSGNCAALNRPNALSNEWDANELEIVQSSLSLGVRLWRKDLETKDALLPSSAEIQLGIMKVFMLEEEQQQGGNIRASGKITGRDIYRNEKVAELLLEHFNLANKIFILRPDQDDLERVCQRQYGISLPFYQFYTSLVGLYDGISFGMELFGRAILVPLQMRYPVEYRRLIWIDYAHYLSTIVTRIEDAPNGLQSYISEEETDDSIIRGMAMALMSGDVKEERNELLFAIATQQLARIMWSKRNGDKESQKSKSLIKTLFQERAHANSVEIPSHHLQAVRQRILEWKIQDLQDLSVLSKDERIKLIEQS